MDDQILIGILRRLRWLEAHAVHYRIAEDGTAMLTWRGARSALAGVGGGGDVYLANANVFTQDNTFSSAGPDTIKLTSATTPGITFGAAGDIALYRGFGGIGGGATPVLLTDDWLVSSEGVAAEDVPNTIGVYLDASLSGASWGVIGVYFATADLATSYAFMTGSWTGSEQLMTIRGDGRLEWGDGTNPLDTNLYRHAANYLRTNDAFICDLSMYVDFAGAGTKLYFGSAADTNLYRGAANLLQTDDAFRAMQAVSAGTGLAGGNGAFLTAASGDSAERLIIANSGQIFWGDGAGANDTNLYRNGANELRTDDNLYVGGFVWVDVNGTGTRLYFGTAGDTNLYRSAADTLMTDDSFQVAGYVWVDTNGTGDGLYFGSAADTNCVRIGAAKLKMNGALTAASGTSTTGWNGGHFVYEDEAFGITLGYDGAYNTTLLTRNDSEIRFAKAPSNPTAQSDLTTLGKLTSTGLTLPQAGATALNFTNDTGGITFNDVTMNSSTVANRLDVNGEIKVTRTTTGGDVLSSQIPADGQRRLLIEADGAINWGDGTLARDTILYRSGPDALKTDDSFECASFSTGQGFMEVDAGAIGGSAGTPSSTNRYVTMDDGVWDVLGGGEIRPGTSDIAHDASSNVAAGTGDLSWTHTPVGVPAGVVVQIVQNVGINDEVISVTYGGVAMNPIHQYSAYVLGSEPGAIYSYFLGFDIPAGPVTVAVDVDGTASSKRAVCHTVTSGKPVRACLATEASHSGAANPSATLALPTYMESAVYGVLHSGQDDVSSITAGANYTEVLEHNFGTQCASWIRRTSNTTGGDTAVNWTVASESYKAIGVALTQVQARDYGRAETLPSRGTIGDRVSVAVDDQVNPGRLIWEFVFESYFGGSSDWHFIGGSPLHTFDATGRTRAANTYAALTSPLSLTVPFAGDYDIAVRARIITPGAAIDGGFLSYTVGATAASDTWAAFTYNGSGAVGHQGIQETTNRHVGVTAGAVIGEQAKCVNTNTITFQDRRLWVQPVRIG